MRALIPIYVKVRSRIDSVLDNEKGATMVEYALMAALIAAVAAVTVGLLGQQVNTSFQAVKDAFTAQ